MATGRAVRVACETKNMDNISLSWFYRTFYLLMITVVGSSNCLHIKGTYRSSDFFKFLAKFGFQQTNLLDKINTQGYIYGNITSAENVTTDVTLVVVDSEYFLEFYGNNSVLPRTKACSAMFNKLDTIAWDYPCNPEGKEDFLRKVPCPQGKLCPDEDRPEGVVSGAQFTYAIQDTRQARFWYASLVSCHRNTSSLMNTGCWWTYNSQQDILLNFDIWLVNGNPFTKHVNPFEHQFSFEMHDVFELYLVFFVVYSFLVPIQLYALSRQKHLLPLLLTTSMCMEYVGVLFNFVHVFKFAFDGQGVDLLHVVGNFIDQVAECLFMLLLLLIVKGWTITRMDLNYRTKAILFTVWGSYTVANLALFIWNQLEMDLIYNPDEWQTKPGYLILIFRLIIMVWFLIELRETISMERSREKTRFYLHLGAGFLVWFVYLPIVAVICSFVSALWRYKTILSVSYAADFLSFVVMTHLLWPSRSYLYFNLKVSSRVPQEELEFAGMRFPQDDLDSGSEDSIDIRETANLLRQKASEDNIRSPERKEATVRWVAGTESVTGLANGSKLNKGEGSNGEGFDSGVESIANGEPHNNGGTNCSKQDINLDSLD